MILSRIKKIISRNKNLLSYIVKPQNDRYISFIDNSSIPELQTIISAPGELKSTIIKAKYDAYTHKLDLYFSYGTHITFIFRDEEITVLSPEPFSKKAFQIELKQALLTYAKSHNKTSSPALPTA